MRNGTWGCFGGGKEGDGGPAVWLWYLPFLRTFPVDDVGLVTKTNQAGEQGKLATSVIVERALQNPNLWSSTIGLLHDLKFEWPSGSSFHTMFVGYVTLSKVPSKLLRRIVQESDTGARVSKRAKVKQTGQEVVNGVQRYELKRFRTWESTYLSMEGVGGSISKTRVGRDREDQSRSQTIASS